MSCQAPEGNLFRMMTILPLQNYSLQASFHSHIFPPLIRRNNFSSRPPHLITVRDRSSGTIWRLFCMYAFEIVCFAHTLEVELTTYGISFFLLKARK
jgi:hypothetical protein